MLVVSEFLLDELAKYLEAYLIKDHAHWLRLHFEHLYHKSFKNENQELQKWSNDILIKYPDKIFESENFASLPENALTSLIKRDDLQMEEGKIWEDVIRWGIAQSTDLPSDPEDWSHENFLTLKTTLQNYRQITSTILPLRKILTATLPHRVTEPFPSTVINEVHAAEIASWVDKKNEVYSVTKNPYKFKLLLRGTRDGFTAETFWNLCDKQTNTVVVMKVKGTDEIFGGYNPVAWYKSVDNYVSCNDSFIFSLKNGTIQSSILSRVKDIDTRRAIYCNSASGPCFGGGRDIYMGNNSNQEIRCYYCHRSYEKAIRNINGTSHFCVEEYEIFQIQKK